MTPPAGASTTVGEDFDISGCTGSGTPKSYLQVQTQSAGNAYEVPFDGVITSWSGTNGLWDHAGLRVVRLGTGTNFTVIGADAQKPDGAVNLVRIPVRQRDVLGLYFSGSQGCIGSNSAGAGYVTRQTVADPPLGGTGSFDSVNDKPGFRMGVTAQIERDADGDGYGDETQDLCPTVASTQGPCPLPTVLGQTFAPAPLGSGSPGGNSYVVTSSPGVVSAAPANGVVTSWSYLAGSDTDGSIKLKMMRPEGGSSYRPIGESAKQTPVANTMNTFPVRIPVQQGDRLGGWTDNIGIVSSVSPPNSLGTIVGDPAIGVSTTYPPTNRRLAISAALEADRDGDGYGDTSQDLCPTDATTQGACRTDPPVDQACEKARKKLEKAKAKLKRLKQKDAAAKKVKAAKKKVKKVKVKVKKAC
jgi:hypothetical protein